MSTSRKSLLIFLIASISLMCLALKNPPSPGTTYAYPSPSSCGWVALTYHMREDGVCRVRVYHERGALVSSFQGNRSLGTSESRVNVCPFAPGVYIYRLTLQYASGASENLGGKFVVKP
jgi:hypothetical protein